MIVYNVDDRNISCRSWFHTLCDRQKEVYSMSCLCLGILSNTEQWKRATVLRTDIDFRTTCHVSVFDVCWLAGRSHSVYKRGPLLRPLIKL